MRNVSTTQYESLAVEMLNLASAGCKKKTPSNELLGSTNHGVCSKDRRGEGWYAEELQVIAAKR